MIAVNYCSNEHLPARKAFINHRYLLNLKSFLILKIIKLTQRYSRLDITDSVNQTTKLEQGEEGGVYVEVGKTVCTRNPDVSASI